MAAMRQNLRNTRRYSAENPTKQSVPGSAWWVFAKKWSEAIYDCLNVNRKRFTFNGLSLTLEVQKMKLEEKLVALRKAKGLSQMKLAEMMNVSRQAISRWERGTAVPSTDNLRCLGNLYGLSVDVFLNDTVELPLQEREGNTREIATQGTDKKHIKIIVAVIFLLLAILVVAISINGNDGDAAPIEEMENIPWESADTEEFEVDW